jgi:hypothetical protein
VPVPAIEVLRVRPLQSVHSCPEVGRLRLDEQMDVIAHLAVSQAVPAHAHGHARKRVQVPATIGVIDIDRLLAIAASGDVMDADFVFGARSAGHVSSSPPARIFAPG